MVDTITTNPIHMKNIKRQEAGRLNALKRWPSRWHIVQELRKYEDKDWLDWFTENMETRDLRRTLLLKMQQKKELIELKNNIK